MPATARPAHLLRPHWRRGGRLCQTSTSTDRTPGSWACARQARAMPLATLFLHSRQACPRAACFRRLRPALLPFPGPPTRQDLEAIRANSSHSAIDRPRPRPDLAPAVGTVRTVHTPRTGLAHLESSARETPLAPLVIEREMSREDLERVEAFLLEELKRAEEPVPPADLFERGARPPFRFSASAIRRAIWHLASTGRISFTDDWQLVADAGAA